jgi:diguanylate cyclase (GGDEF)-like protein
MKGGWTPSEPEIGVLVTPDALDRLMPMHLRVDASGHILHAGPTLRKLRAETEWIGARLLEVFEFRRPRGAQRISDILASQGRRLQLQFRTAPATTLNGIVVPLPGDGGLVLNLSFGISVVEAVSTYGLTVSDFAATDLTVEMLYLVEAKSAAMEESRKLNQRLQGARIAAEEQAFTDTLTGLKNRRAMDHVLSRITGADERFALMHLDLDFFKDVNDSLGHAAGDHVLQQVARVLVEETRGEDTVARVGGDEFVIIFKGLTDLKRLGDVAARIIDKLEKPMAFNGSTCRISASIGTTVSEFYDTPDIEKMLSDADVALYASKRKGRACWTVHSGDMARLAQPPDAVFREADQR